MKLTQFTLYKNTLFTDMQNTVHFNSNNDRDQFFDREFTGENVKTFQTSFNFRRDMGTLKVPELFENLMGFNYCRFVNGFDKKTYYAYIVSMKYLNDNTTQLDLVIYTVMTYTQGNILENLQNVEDIRQHIPQNIMNNRIDSKVIRKHLPHNIINYRMDYLRNNSDKLQTSYIMLVDSTLLGGAVFINDLYYIIQTAIVLD